MNQPAHPFLAQVGALAHMAGLQAAAHVGLLAHTGDSASDAQSSLSQAQNSLSACQNATIQITSSDCADCVNYALAAAQAAASADQTLPSQYQDTTGTIAGAVNTISSIDTTTAIASDGATAVSAAQSAVNQMLTDSAAYAASPGGGGGAPSGQPSQNQQASTVQQAAADAVDAINSDPNACTNVAKSGTAVNSAVHAFKLAFNASGQGNLAFNGQYDSATANAIASVLGSGAPAACSGGPSPQPHTNPVNPNPVNPPGPAPQQANILTMLMDNWMLVAGVTLAAIGVGYVVEKHKHGSAAAGASHDDHSLVTPPPSSIHALPPAGGSSAAHRAYGRRRGHSYDYGYPAW